MLQGPYTILIVLAITMLLFIWGRWRYDIVAMIALLLGVLSGSIPFHQVYTGFSNPAVITVACVMIISQAITRSGVVDTVVRNIVHVMKSPTLHVGLLSLITAILSAFMNNVGALALMMPVAIQTASKSKRSPSLVLMPIALASAMGGLLTMIGTPPNLLIAAYRQETTGAAFSMFDFSHVGIFVALAGLLFITLLGWRLIPKTREGAKRTEELFQVQDYITEIKVPEDSSSVGITVRDLEKKIQGDFIIAGLIRQKKKRLVVPAQETLKANDILIVEIAPEDLQELLEVAQLELASQDKITTDVLSSDDITLMEAVVPPGSRIEGRSSQSLRLRSRHQINLLAIAREGKAFKQRLHHVFLRGGDVVLLQGASDLIQETVAQLGFLPLVQRGIKLNLKRKAFLPILIFMIAITLAALQLVPVQVAFGGAVLGIVFFKCIPPRVMYDSIDWPVIILLGAMIPLGEALQRTGGTSLIAHSIIQLTQHMAPLYILGTLLIVTMTLSDFMNNAATTVVMAPIANSMAQAMHASADPFLMAVAIGASCSFLTPVGHQNNTLVMGPGGYKFTDYIRVGLPLELLVIVTALPLLLWAWPIQ